MALTVLFLGVFLVAFGVLAAAYIFLERRRGNLRFKPLSIKENATLNLPFILISLGITFILASFVIP
jgi:hypothetical protein